MPICKKLITPVKIKQIFYKVYQLITKTKARLICEKIITFVKKLINPEKENNKKIKEN